MSHPTQVRIISPKADPDSLPVPGDIYRGGDNIWYDCCPKCGIVAALSNHTVVEEDDGTITVTPSIVCQCDRKGAKCDAHYFITKSVITYV